MNAEYIIVDRRPDTRVDYIAAPPGYYWSSVGKVIQEPKGHRSASPEWSHSHDRVYRFKSHRAAAIVCNQCHTATIEKVQS